MQLKNTRIQLSYFVSVDGTGDVCENDFDGDGVVDAEDACPNNKEIKKANFNNYKTVKLSDNQASGSEKYAEWKVTSNGSEITQLVDNFPEMLIGKYIFLHINDHIFYHTISMLLQVKIILWIWISMELCL